MSTSKRFLRVASQRPLMLGSPDRMDKGSYCSRMILTPNPASMWSFNSLWVTLSLSLRLKHTVSGRFSAGFFLSDTAGRQRSSYLAHASSSFWMKLCQNFKQNNFNLISSTDNCFRSAFYHMNNSLKYGTPN